MKWLTIVLAGCVLVTVWARTVPLEPERLPGSRTEAERDARATLRDLAAAAEAHREYVRADSLLPLLPATPGVTVSLSAALPAATRDSVNAVLRHEMAELGEPHARLGVFLIEHGQGERPGYAFEREIHVGTDSAGVYCAMVETAPVVRGVLNSSGFGVGPRLPGQRRSASVLGPCAFIAAYGAPGTHVAEWLRQGGYGFAELRGAAAERDTLRDGSEQIWLYSGEDLWLRGCRGGRAELCARAALAPRESTLSDGAASFDLRSFRYINRSSRTMLHQLEQRYGAQRFAQFWTSDADVPTAFTRAFGVDVGEWMGEWGRSRYGTVSLGAGIDAFSLMLCLLTIAAFAAIAAVVARRRTVA